MITLMCIVAYDRKLGKRLFGEDELQVVYQIENNV